MVRIMVLLGFITMLAGCDAPTSSQGAAQTASHGGSMLGTDVDLSQAKPYRQIGFESFPAPDGKPRYRIVISAEDATTDEQRAQTAMLVARKAAQGGAYEVTVWLDEGNQRLAVADYYPYGQMAFGAPSPYVWDVTTHGRLYHRH